MASGAVNAGGGGGGATRGLEGGVQRPERGTAGLKRLAEEVIRLAKHDADSKKPFSRAFRSIPRDDIISQITSAACHFSLIGMQVTTDVKATGSRDLVTQANRVVRSIDKAFTSLYRSCSLIVQRPAEFKHRTTAVNSLLEAMVWVKELFNLSLLLDRIKINNQLGKTQRCIAKLESKKSSMSQLHRLYGQAVQLYTQFLQARDSASSAVHGSNCASTSGVLKWSQQLMNMTTLLAKTKTSLGEGSQGLCQQTSASASVLSLLSGCLDKLKSLLEQDEADTDTLRRREKSKATESLAGFLIRRLTSYERLAAKEPPNRRRADLEAHISSLRQRWNTLLQWSAVCIDISTQDHVTYHSAGGSHENELMSSRQTKAELAVETASFAHNALLSVISELPSSDTPRNLATLKNFDDSLNKLLPALSSLRRRLFRVSAEHYVNVLAQIDPALGDLVTGIPDPIAGPRSRPVSELTLPLHGPRTDTHSVTGASLTSPLSPISSVSSVSLDLPFSSGASRSHTPSPSSPLRPFSPLQQAAPPGAHRFAAVEELVETVDCPLESDYLKCKAAVEEECQRLKQLCKSSSLLGRSEAHVEMAELVSVKLRAVTDMIIHCGDEQRQRCDSRKRTALQALSHYCLEQSLANHWDSCLHLGKELPLLDIVSAIDTQVTDGLEACRTFAQMHSGDILCKTLRKAANLLGHLVHLLRRWSRSQSAERLRPSSPRRSSKAASYQDDQLAPLVNRLESKVFPAMKLLHQSAVVTTSTLRSELKSGTQQVMEFLNDLHLASRYLTSPTGWNQTDAEVSDDEVDVVDSGALQTIPEVPADDSQDGIFHSRAVNLSTIAEESELSDDDDGFGLKRSQSLSRRSSLRASCRMLSLPEVPFAEKNDQWAGLFDEWPWAQVNIQAAARDLFQAVDHALAMLDKSQFQSRDTDLPKLIKLCQVQWEEVNEQCLAMLKAILGDSLPQKLVALYANTSLVSHQLSSHGARITSGGRSNKLDQNSASLLHHTLTDLQQSVMDTLSTTPRYTTIRSKVRSKSKGQAHTASHQHRPQPQQPVLAECSQAEYFL